MTSTMAMVMMPLPPQNRVFCIQTPRSGARDFRCSPQCCVALQDDYVLYYYANLSVPVGRFQNRVRLVGDISRSDGSLLLQNVEEADQGTYTCEIRFEMESLVFKKAVVLHVLPEETKGMRMLT